MNNYLRCMYLRNIKYNDLIKKTIQDFYDVDESIPIHFEYDFIDLNDDGNLEIFVYIDSPYFCGTGGCSGLLLSEKNNQLHVISNFSVLRKPIIISNNKTNGYKDIITYVAGGGIEPFYALLQFDGTKYPSNPSIQPSVDINKVNGSLLLQKKS